MSSPPKFQFLRRLPDRDLICPICQETFDGEGLYSNERRQGQNEPQQANSDTADTTSRQSTETSHNSTTAETNPRRPTAAEEASSQSSDTDRTPVRVACCNNIFCCVCLLTWLLTANTCPMCRAVLFEREGDPEDDEEYEPALGPGAFEVDDNSNDNNDYDDNHYVDMDYNDYDNVGDHDDGYDSSG